MRLVVVLTLGALACNPDLTVEIDPAFSQQDHQAIRAAADTWNSYTGEGGRKLLVVPRGDDVLVLSAHAPPGYLGFEQGRWKLVRIDPDAPRHDVYAIALHEFGHALGLRHTSAGLMMGTEKSVEFTEEVRDECERASACD